MSFVNMVSGGLDSSLVSLLAKEKGTVAYPLFIDYGQRAAGREWAACQAIHARYGLPKPVRMNLSGFGQVIRSGLTSPDLDIKEAAFTPCRNLMFLLMGAAYAYQIGTTNVAIGLLSEDYSLFPDQTSSFVRKTEDALTKALGRSIKILTPLSDFCKRDVVKLAQSKGLDGTYSCHAGGERPCGHCIACQEYDFGEEE